MQAVTRATVDEFYRAYKTRQGTSIAPFLDDDIDWILSGPVGVMPHCGQRRGAAEVLQVFNGRFPAIFAKMNVVTPTILIDGDRVAMLGMLSAVLAKTGQNVSYRIAHFMQFRDGKIVEFRGIIDSFDAAEQILGHALDTTQDVSAERDFELLAVV
ncbi:MAG: nuclear transport factor 2 family protein [Alphaproteobacteria bacterium]|nr:nuclear transport factor 2 family protein [Alphaproteobacteria bacterium]